MEKVKAKDFLRQHELSRAKIETLEQEIANLYESTISAPIGDGQPRGTDISDSTGKLASKIADMRSETEYLWEQQQRIRRRVESVLLRLEDTNDFRVCWKRYIDLKKWDEIAEEMEFTTRTVQWIHGRALLEVQKILDAEQEETLKDLKEPKKSGKSRPNQNKGVNDERVL